MNLRCFIAVDIDDRMKEELRELIDVLKKHDGDVKWVSHENAHLTLKFLGPTREDTVSRIGDSLRNVASAYKPFYIRICGTGVFPNRRNPRVIWVGLDAADSLGRLKRDIENAMAPFGYQREDREFRPHLTLGRVRSRKGMIGILREIDVLAEKDFGTISVNGIKLMKSELKPKGAEYTCLYDMHFPES